MRNKWLLTAAVSGFAVVSLGAFGAHALQAVLAPGDLAIWQTAVQYQMFHTLALLAVACLHDRPGRRLSHWAGGLFGVGILIFCGSLYLLVLTGQRWLGAVTPIGGAAFLGGWAALALAAFKDG